MGGDEWDTQLARGNEKRGEIFVDKEQGNILIAKPKLALEDRIRSVLKYVSYEDLYWIYLSLERIPMAGSCKYDNEISNL